MIADRNSRGGVRVPGQRDRNFLNTWGGKKKTKQGKTANLRRKGKGLGEVTDKRLRKPVNRDIIITKTDLALRPKRRGWSWGRVRSKKLREERENSVATGRRTGGAPRQRRQ